MLSKGANALDAKQGPNTLDAKVGANALDAKQVCQRIRYYALMPRY